MSKRFPEPVLWIDNRPKKGYAQAAVEAPGLKKKSFKKDDVHIEYKDEQKLILKIAIPGDTTYESEWDLPDKVNPEKCDFKIFDEKIEVHMKKLEKGDWQFIGMRGRAPES